MDGEALQALELPAILERLAAAAATELGSALARALVPSDEPGEVGTRQAQTAEAVVLLDGADDPPLAGVTEVGSFVERAERDGVLSPADLRAVATSSRVAVDARRVVHGRREAVPLLAAIAERIEPSLVQLAVAIDRCVEEDGSDLRDDASPKLRKLRRDLRNGDARLRDELAPPKHARRRSASCVSSRPRWRRAETRSVRSSKPSANSISPWRADRCRGAGTAQKCRSRTKCVSSARAIRCSTARPQCRSTSTSAICARS